MHPYDRRVLEGELLTLLDCLLEDAVFEEDEIVAPVEQTAEEIMRLFGIE